MSLLSSSSFSFQNWTVNNHPAGLVRQSPNLTYVRVFGAGHEVPAYNYTDLEVGQAALEFFRLTMTGTEFVAAPAPSSSGGSKSSAMALGVRRWGYGAGVVFLGAVSALIL